MSAEKVIPCTGCQRRTRPARSTLAEFPDTVARYGGRCMTCYSRESTRVPGRATVDQNTASLESYMQARSNRIRKATI